MRNICKAKRKQISKMISALCTFVIFAVILSSCDNATHNNIYADAAEFTIEYSCAEAEGRALVRASAGEYEKRDITIVFTDGGAMEGVTFIKEKDSYKAKRSGSEDFIILPEGEKTPAFAAIKLLMLQDATFKESRTDASGQRVLTFAVDGGYIYATCNKDSDLPHTVTRDTEEGYFTVRISDYKPL